MVWEQTGTSRWKCTVFICSKGPYRAVHSDRDLATLFCFTEEILTIRRTLAYTGNVHYLIVWGRADRGFWLCEVASLVMYCTDASLRIVSKEREHKGRGRDLLSSPALSLLSSPSLSMSMSLRSSSLSDRSRPRSWTHKTVQYSTEPHYFI